jgi:hypothetical protein
MTREEIDQLAALEAKAAPGPWGWGTTLLRMDRGLLSDMTDEQYAQHCASERLIIAARNALPALLAAARAALAAPAEPRVVEVAGCRDCPLSNPQRMSCQHPATDGHGIPNGYNAPAPAWCALKTAPLLVRLGGGK